ncbi:MAG: hypothetical protein ACRERC_14770 [Candidatus Binatia bacterium]
MPKGGIETTIGHWSKLLGGLTTTPQDFYAAVEAAIQRRQIPDCKLSRTDWSEEGFTSAKREYLRVERDELLIDICGAPFGNQLFASSWLCAPPPNLTNAIAGAAGCLALMGFLVSVDIGFYKWLIFILALIAFCGIIAVGIVRPLYFPPRLTYYRIDTAEMFYQLVHDAVLEVIDGLSSAQGLRFLSEAERKPVMRDYASSSHAGPQPAAA